MSNKPDWRKGDVLVPAEGTGMGSTPFVAEMDPTNGFYGYTPAEKFRKATAADCERYIGYVNRNIAREQDSLAAARECLRIVQGEKGGGGAK